MSSSTYMTLATRDEFDRYLAAYDKLATRHDCLERPDMSYRGEHDFSIVEFTSAMADVIDGPIHETFEPIGHHVDDFGIDLPWYSYRIDVSAFRKMVFLVSSLKQDAGLDAVYDVVTGLPVTDFDDDISHDLWRRFICGITEVTTASAERPVYTNVSNRSYGAAPSVWVDQNEPDPLSDERRPLTKIRLPKLDLDVRSQNESFTSITERRDTAREVAARFNIVTSFNEWRNETHPFVHECLLPEMIENGIEVMRFMEMMGHLKAICDEAGIKTVEYVNG